MQDYRHSKFHLWLGTKKEDKITPMWFCFYRLYYFYLICVRNSWFQTDGNFFSLKIKVNSLSSLASTTPPPYLSLSINMSHEIMCIVSASAAATRVNTPTLFVELWTAVELFEAELSFRCSFPFFAVCYSFPFESHSSKDDLKLDYSTLFL